jgi:hypothetical protein
MRRFLLTVIFLFSSVSHAAAITWTLNDVAFDDGTSASGYFDYDAELNLFSNINIFGGEGAWPNPGFYYDVYGAADSNDVTFLGDGGSFGTVTLLNLVFDSSLTSAGGSIGLSTSSWEREEDFGSGFVVRSRNVISGSVSAVPVPAAVWLLGSALFGLVISRRRVNAP